MEKRKILTIKEIDQNKLYLLAYDPIHKIPRVVKIIEIIPKHNKSTDDSIICKFLTPSTPQFYVCSVKDLKLLTPEIIKDYKDEVSILIATAERMQDEISSMFSKKLYML